MLKPDQEKLARRYERIVEQLKELFTKNADPQSRMATAVAVLHHKMPHFSWTGFYRLEDGDLLVGPYQGPLACSILERGKGCCWHCANTRNAVVVPDVREFPGHIFCDDRTLSEVVVPVFDGNGDLTAVLDVDSLELDSFTEVDAAGLTAVCQLIYNRP